VKLAYFFFLQIVDVLLFLIKKIGLLSLPYQYDYDIQLLSFLYSLRMFLQSIIF
jgi:hypothetical protein